MSMEEALRGHFVQPVACRWWPVEMKNQTATTDPQPAFPIDIWALSTECDGV